MRLMHEFLQTALVSTHDRNTPRVKVAVLSTGVDLNHRMIRRVRVGGCRSFVGDDQMNVLDYHGLGTHQVSVLSGIAPAVELYICKITESSYITDAGIKPIVAVC